MSNQNTTRYTLQQIMCGLRQVWPDMVGSKLPFESTTRIDQYHEEVWIWDELDFADVIYWLERFFGFRCPTKDWEEFLGAGGRSAKEWQAEVAPRLTFGALAEFIAERIIAVSIASVEFVGRPCTAAGVFFGIEQVARQVSSSVERFGPSTPIQARFRGRSLLCFWNRLRWITEDRLPPLPPRWVWVATSCRVIAVLITALTVIASFWQANVVLLVAGLLTSIGLVVLANGIDRFASPLPRSITTFRDIAVVVANYVFV